MENVLTRENRISIDELGVDETIFSQANGVLGVRASFAEGYGNEFDQPYALINGFYNLYPFHYEENSIHFPQSGQTIIKCPDATTIRIKANDININMNECHLIDLRRRFHLDKGYVSRLARYQSPSGEIFDIYEERIVSQKVKGLVGIQLTISTTSYTGSLNIESELSMPLVKEEDHTDPRVAQEKQHLECDELSIQGQMALMSVKTTLSDKKLRVGIRHNVEVGYREHDEKLIAHYETQLEKGKAVIIEKFAYYDSDLTNPKGLKINEALYQYEDFKSLKADQLIWAHAFNQESFFEISDESINLALHYAMYQLNSSGGENDDIQIAAKGISGEGYEGHYFWDTEIYMLPYFILNHPEKAKRLLKFRYRHIKDAKEEALHLGVNRGIKIPWRTINGKETSPYYPAGSAQIHINSDVAYSIMAYYNMTHDTAFMDEVGIELMIETALFILDYGVFKDGHYHINTVTGPDEYTALVNDNYYTNAMAQEHFRNVIKLSNEFSESFKTIMKRLGYEDTVLNDLKKAADLMVMKVENEVIVQDDSFMQKKALPLESIPSDKHPMLLHYHPLYIYRHQILKQADTVLAMVLLNLKKDACYKKSYQFYMNKTTHDSSLSKCIYGIAAYGLDQNDLATQYFKESLYIDLNDERNHSKHGLHLANIGGSYLILVYGIFGLRMGEILSLEPIKKSPFDLIKLNVKYLGSNLHLELSKTTFKISCDQSIKVKLYGEDRLIEPLNSVLINLS